LALPAGISDVVGGVPCADGSAGTGAEKARNHNETESKKVRAFIVSSLGHALWRVNRMRRVASDERHRLGLLQKIQRWQ
jgi:hypothetical protein